MTLVQGSVNTTFTVTAVDSVDKEIKDFLFSLGCYSGEEITIISKLSSTVAINIKNARYSIDSDLAGIILVEPLITQQNNSRYGAAQSAYA